MKKQGMFAVFVILVAFLVVYPTLERGSAQTTPRKTIETTTHSIERPKLLKMPADKKILAREFFADLRLHTCKGTSAPPPRVSRTEAQMMGGFSCDTTYDITLTIAGNGVTPSQDVITGVQPGNCIRWSAFEADGRAASIVGINFLDSAQEARDVGKPESNKSFRAIGPDLCVNREKCLVYIAVPDGHYYYVASVRGADGQVRKTDPEVDVNCGTHCGPEDDL